MKAIVSLCLLVATTMLAACGSGGETPSERGDNGGTLERPERKSGKRGPIPKFGDYQDVKEKKAAFFDYMNAKVLVANDDVWAERLFILAVQEKFESSALEDDEFEELVALAEYYGVPPSEPLDADFFEELLKRVDVVPASLALAQAANESAWGTSRFALEGRNFFGIWCFQAGCGIPPNRRDAGATHEVRKFRTVLAGIRYYIHNINTGGPYAELREVRAEIRQEDEKPTGVQLAKGLIKYSERGDEYIAEISAMIRQNKLARYSVRRALAPQP